MIFSVFADFSASSYEGSELIAEQHEMVFECSEEASKHVENKKDEHSNQEEAHCHCHAGHAHVAIGSTEDAQISGDSTPSLKAEFHLVVDKTRNFHKQIPRPPIV